MERPHRQFASGWQANGPAGAIGNLDMTFVVLWAPGSSQELELNYYPEETRFATKYRSGEELDHLAFLVDGVEVAIDSAHAKRAEVYVKDPDGIWIERLD